MCCGSRGNGEFYTFSKKFVLGLEKHCTHIYLFLAIIIFHILIFRYPIGNHTLPNFTVWAVKKLGIDINRRNRPQPLPKPSDFPKPRVESGTSLCRRKIASFSVSIWQNFRRFFLIFFLTWNINIFFQPFLNGLRSSSLELYLRFFP